MRIFFSIIITCVVAYIIFMTWLYLNQRNLMYAPGKDIHSLSYYDLKNTSEITLTTQDHVNLQAWYHKPAGNKPMVIFLQGNTGSLGDRADKLRALSNLGYGFIIPSWRGFGKSQGSPTMQGLYFDAEAAIDFVRKQGYPVDDCIMVGESLGTGIATEMATKYKFKGLFLITPYTSIANRAHELYPLAIMPERFTKDNFDVVNKIGKIDQPLLIIHGTKDTVIPYNHSEIIFARAKEPKKLIIYPDAGHNNYDVVTAFEQMDSYFTK